MYSNLSFRPSEASGEIFLKYPTMNFVTASGEVLKVYQTGDRPILVLCSDGNHYICKYKQPGYAAYKLLSELVGGVFAKTWGIATPVTSLVVNDPIIWDDAGISHDPVAPLLGSRKMEGVFDLGEFNCNQVEVSWRTLSQLLLIALFDLWLANEDRTCNNYNLLYDIKEGNLVSIDYGGIFNSGILNNPIYQLNAADSIVSSDLFCRLKTADTQKALTGMYILYFSLIAKCKKIVPVIIDGIPQEWKVEKRTLERKFQELFAMEWINETWYNFKDLVERT